MGAKAIIAIMIVSCATVYQASNWWERAFAKIESSEFSPDGCIRVDTYRPFWILPSELHRLPEPDENFHNDLGKEWDSAIFKRAYESKTGELLGETVVYDPVGQKVYGWGDTRTTGRRIVTVNGFPFVDTTHCADAPTLKRLEAFNERKRLGKPASPNSL